MNLRPAQGASTEATASVIATFARFESRRIGERTAEGIAKRRAAGQRWGRERAMPPKIAARIRREPAAAGQARPVRVVRDGRARVSREAGLTPLPRAEQHCASRDTVRRDAERGPEADT